MTAMENVLAAIEDVVHVETGQHVFRSGWDGSFTPAAGALVEKLTAAMTAPEMVEVVAKALYLSVVSFPGELHPPLSDLRQREQEKYHRHARAVLAGLTKAGAVEWGSEDRHGNGYVTLPATAPLESLP